MLAVAVIGGVAIGITIAVLYAHPWRSAARKLPEDQADVMIAIDYDAWVDKDGKWHAPCKRADIPPGQELKKGWLGRRPWKPRPQDVLDEPRAIKGGL